MNLWLPTIPYSLIDCINRVAAAQGSPRYAMAASDADYNGHYVIVDQSPVRPGWRAHYTWAGINWLTRGADVRHALRVAHDEYKRGAKGATVLAAAIPEDAVDFARSLGYVDYSEEIGAAHYATWKDARFEEVGSAMRYERQLGCPAVGFLANSKTLEEYKAKVDAFFQEQRARRVAR
jgi:hypothetical protein